MFNPTRKQVLFSLAIIVGLIVGRIIKNFKLGLALAILLGLLMVIGKSTKRK